MMSSSPSVPRYTSAHQALITFPVKSTSSTPTAPSPVVSKYARYLKSKYKKYLGSIPGKLVLTLGKEYVPLTLVKYEIDTQEKAEEFFLKLHSGNVDQSLAERREIKVKDIFKPGKNTRLVVVEGEPGIGKSTLALELCHQWQNGNSLQHFSIVLLLKLREESVRSAKHIRDLFFHPDDKIRDKLLEEMNENLGEGVLIIFDGFDELPVELRKGSLISDLINSPDNLSEATIMVTTRPSASAEMEVALKKVALKNVTTKYIQIVGFSKNSIHTAASKVFNDPKLFSAFIKYLSRNPAVEALIHNPLNCAIVVKLYKQNFITRKRIHHTLTWLYTELSRYLISSYLIEEGDTFLAQALPEKLEKFPKKLYYPLLDVGELAYNGAVNGNREIFEKIPGNSTGLGLLIEHHTIFSVNETIKYNFFHKSLQDFMTAFYISQQKPNKQREIIEMGEESTVDAIKFVAGLTKTVYEEVLTISVMKQWGTFDFYSPFSVSRLAITCLYEAGNSENCMVFDGYGFEVFKFEGFFREYDMYAIGYVISLCGNSWNLILPDTTESELEMFGHGLENNPHSEGSIHMLALTSSNGIMNQGKNLLQIPGHILHKIEILLLNHCNMSHDGFQNLAMCVPKLHNLRTLVVDSSINGPGSLVSLMQSLKTHGKLESLSMERLEMGMKDISALSAMIQSSNSLKVLQVGGGLKSTPEIDTQLVKTVLSPSSLVDVEVKFKSRSHYNFSILEGIEIISNSLQSLTLRDVSEPQERRVSTEKGTGLRTLLQENTSLRHLSLLFNLNRNELENLLLWLEENKSLETLELSEDVRRLIPESEKILDNRISFGIYYDNAIVFPLKDNL